MNKNNQAEINDIAIPQPSSSTITPTTLDPKWKQETTKCFTYFKQTFTNNQTIQEPTLRTICLEYQDFVNFNLENINYLGHLLIKLKSMKD